MNCSVSTSTGSHPESSVPQTEGMGSHDSHIYNPKRDKEGERILAGMIKFSEIPESRAEINRLRRLDRPRPVGSVLGRASTSCRTSADGSSSPVASIFPGHSISDSGCYVLPTWVPTTEVERVHYYGANGEKSGFDRTERHRSKREANQNSSVRATTPELKTSFQSECYNPSDPPDHSFKSSSINGSITLKHIVGYGPPESTVVPPTILPEAESGQEGRDTIVPGWTQESMDQAWRRFLPGPPRSVEPHMSILEAFDRNFRDTEGSGSESGSIRTVRLAIAKDVEWGDEYEGDGSGSSNSSTGTVIHMPESR